MAFWSRCSEEQITRSRQTLSERQGNTQRRSAFGWPGRGLKRSELVAGLLPTHTVRPSRRECTLVRERLTDRSVRQPNRLRLHPSAYTTDLDRPNSSSRGKACR